MSLLRSNAVAQWRCCAVALLRGGAVARLRSGVVAQCAVDRGSKMRIEDQGSDALLFALRKGEGGEESENAKVKLP